MAGRSAGQDSVPFPSYFSEYNSTGSFCPVKTLIPIITNPPNYESWFKGTALTTPSIHQASERPEAALLTAYGAFQAEICHLRAFTQNPWYFLVLAVLEEIQVQGIYPLRGHAHRGGHAEPPPIPSQAKPFLTLWLPAITLLLGEPQTQPRFSSALDVTQARVQSAIGWDTMRLMG